MKHCNVRIEGPKELAKKIKENLQVHFRVRGGASLYPRKKPGYSKNPGEIDGVRMYMQILGEA